ncbi:hypothetical protein OF829_08975 [Sphingomonas sp. LB-2]|uniref:hypothetical protein n=1 Tax=Sphingomonas caeni TaxID=2984949 RepID=UPI002231E72F|nr:hypothetical protein [Sphingomonas caeni]MCW3847373.1 hypothetical protein [Sphingomonas caeni]
MSAQASIFSRKPTHRLFNVTGDGDNAFWREIGAAWQHKDGKGFSIDCGLVPLTGRIVMREAKEPKEVGARA